jgi:hypothetical protein
MIRSFFSSMLVKQRRAGQPDEKLFKKKSQNSKIIAPPNFFLPTPHWGRPGLFSPLGVALFFLSF